ncbi:MAG: asparagine synthase (glutamine-hydrolyzing) [Hyphomicrobium sp.]
MCGINGIFAYHYAANPIDGGELIRTRDHMVARGPDGAGEWIDADARIGFGHRRLSIIDLSEAGAQPMASADGKLVVTFNGEIYNYRSIKKRLEAQGAIFRTSSDTEVLLHLYAEMGDEMVREIRGMFAFAIWDLKRRRLFLARDPYGVKPLYYSDDGWTFCFASQVKALLAGGRVSREPEPAGEVGFYLWGSVPDPHTRYRAIRALPAGSTLLVDRIGAGEPRYFHSIARTFFDAERSAPQKEEHAQRDVRAALLDSVRHHLIADVPVGAFLSAGVDSSALVGLMRDAGQQDIETVTIAFEEFRCRADDEAVLAKQAADLYGARHTTRVVTKAEFLADLPKILEAMDQPSIDGVNTWFVSKAARELGLKVAISGLGGDELFGGYPSFRDVPRWAAAFAIPSRIPLLGRGLRKIIASCGINRMGVSPKSAGLLEYGGRYAGAYLLRRGLYMPWELEQVLPRDRIEAGLRRLDALHSVEAACQPFPTSSFGRVAALEASRYMRHQLLRDSDWASMAHGLELRVPLVDRELLKRVAPIVIHSPAARGKGLLALSPSTPVPHAIRVKPKTGFTTPIATWLKNEDHAAPEIAGRKAPGRPSEHWSREWSRVALA